MGLDLVPRMGAQMVDPDTMSIVELHQVHVQSSESSQGASARGTLRRRDQTRKVLTHHLYFCMRDCRLLAGEDCEIFFSLYDTKRAAYISERFLVRISRDGFSNYVERLHSNCTIFTDLGNSELSRDVVLVAHVLRVGRMLASESVKQKGGAHHYRRPHGVAVLNISEVLQRERLSEHNQNQQQHTAAPQDLEQEFTFKVFQCEERDFHVLHEFIIRKQSNKYNPLSGGQPNLGIDVSLRLLHGELPQVREEHALLFKNVSLTRKLGFPDVIMPGDVRNDLYLSLEKGEFERGGKSTGKNIEVNVSALDHTGELLEGCLWGASGMEGGAEYQSLVIYHHNSPCWAETLRIALPIDKYSGAHVRLEFRHCSTRDKTEKKMFGFSFLRLMDEGGATVHDATHELHIYKCEDRARLADPAAYLSLPSGPRDSAATAESPPATPGFARSAKEVVSVRTLLCSTKLTQNDDLLALLQWKTHPEGIDGALERVMRLDGEELVKFLQDVLDALFAMFSTEDGNSTAYSGPVFHVLVSICSLLEDTKFEHFKPVMDAYITGHFAAALVYKGLLSSVQHCADWAASTEKQEPIQKTFRSLEYVFKFIIQSRLLFARATGGQYEDSFRRDLLCVFAAINKMLSHSGETVIQTQMALLTSISPVYEQLTAVLPTLECAQLATAMLGSLPRDLPPQLAQAKLTAVRQLVASNLFRDDESRSLLLTASCKHLRLHLAHRNELRLCSDILADVLAFLFRQKQAQQQQGKLNNCLQHDTETLCVQVLDMLLQTVLIILDRTTAVVGYLVACLVGLLQLMTDGHYRRVWTELVSQDSTKPLKDFLLRLFLVFRDLVKQDVFPPDWFVMRAETNLVMLAALREFSQPLALRFLDRLSFDHQLWSSYFNLAVSFLTQPALQLEQFSEVKRDKVLARYGDMRVAMGFQILDMWSRLGEHKISFIPSMVGPFLEVTLVPEPALRKATLHIFFDMMECEQAARGNFKQVESELIDKLDILISENKGDDEYRQLFNTMLLDRVRSEEPVWRETGAAFISSVTRLLERLLDYRSVIQGDENRDKRMSCTYNLLNFYKDEIDRKEMYVRYIHKLHDLHLPADNFTEAGFTMKLYADQLSWSSAPLPATPHFPAQPEWQRKELVYRQIIHYFDRGKCWEMGIPLCKELASLYEMRLFDYAKLSHTLNTQARFFDNILTQLRPEPEYFRVGFYGLSFPLFVRRLQTEFPAAQILTKNTPPEDNIVNSDGQYIQICNVRPVPEEQPMLSGPHLLGVVPERVALFYQVNVVRRFISDRPTHKGPVHRDNEFKGVIDANVMGGIAKYQEAFFTPEFTATHPEFLEAVQTLRLLIFEQVQVLETGLTLHGTLAPAGVQPLHRRLTERLAQLRSGLATLAPHLDAVETPTVAPHHRKVGSIVNTPLPPLPTDKPSEGGAAPGCSARSSSSSGYYGQLTATTTEDIYSRPAEDDAPPAVPARECRPRSAGYSSIVEQGRAAAAAASAREHSGGSLPSVRHSHSREGSLDCGGSDTPPVLRQSKPRALHSPGSRNSWSEPAAAADPPPLPPRTSCGPGDESTPPAPPRRLLASTPPRAEISLEGAEEGESSCDPGVPSWGSVMEDPPLLSPRAQPPPPPPPLPPRAAPTTPADPSLVSSTENYSVPPRLQPTSSSPC
ncbi:hypothetical protein B566_EDAN004617 [Ephemera danica]|nr:hypothetical protein B566_EDAN004617 [Ephemera danica]